MADYDPNKLRNPETQEDMAMEFATFTAAMSARYRSQIGRRGHRWRSTNPADLLQGLLRAVVDAQTSEDNSRPKWADVANYALMLANIPNEELTRLKLAPTVVPVQVLPEEAKALLEDKPTVESKKLVGNMLIRLATYIGSLAKKNAPTPPPKP